jgi:hypothetical protein
VRSPTTRWPSCRTRSATGRGRSATWEPEDDFSDSWHSYRDRAEHLRQTYGWRVPESPRRAEPWLPLGRDHDQDRDSRATAAPSRRCDAHLQVPLAVDRDCSHGAELVGRCPRRLGWWLSVM